MSVALVVTRGYSTGSLVGAIKDVVTRGYTPAGMVTVVSTFGLCGPIDTFGKSVAGTMLSDGQGVTGIIASTFAVCSAITTTGRSVSGTITDAGIGVDGEIKD